ncbi:hypothetical protein M2436_001430 [Streptomyces sp. HB372]|nr:hypothetical protein [Streptomyces sp. HB372]
MRHLLVRRLLLRDLLLRCLRLLPGLLRGSGLVLSRSLVLGRGLVRGRLLSVPARAAALGLLVGLLHGRRLAAGDTGARGGAEAHPGSVGGVAQVQHRAGADFHLLDPLTLHIGAVGAAVVLDEPTTAAPADRGMPPRHPGVVDRQVPLRITSKGVRPGRIERPGVAIQFQYEFRHSAPH